MRILAVDTSAKSCSVAVVDEDSLLAELTLVTGQTHSKHIVGMIDTVINMSGLVISDVYGFATTVGPGSFTGLRIGISSVKGLAAASGKPVVAVSSLDALALQAFDFSSYLVCPLLDARKKEVYCSQYRFIDGILEKKSKEMVLSPEKAVWGISERCIFIGNGASLYQKLIIDKIGELAHFAPSCRNTIRASTVACLSMNRFKKNDADDIDILVPHYIRKSDAQLNLRGS